jgi:ketosteroid isomerase-like protein
MQEGSDRWQTLLADDIEFIGPVMQVKGKQEFIRLNQDFFKMVTGMEIERYAAADKAVATQTRIKANSPKGNAFEFELAEFYDIENGKIRSLRIYYDPREFLKEFSMEP